jgi:hypothetical protein
LGKKTGTAAKPPLPKTKTLIKQPTTKQENPESNKLSALHYHPH